MNKLENFGPVYVINLKDRLDRKKYIEDQMNLWEIKNYKFFPAYDGRHLNGQYKMSGSEIGCSTSHLLAIKDWYENDNSEYVIITEDDLSLDNCKYWKWTWDELISSINLNFDLIQMATWAMDICVPEDLRILQKDVKIPRVLTTCYLITRHGAKSVLEKTIGLDGSTLLDFNDLENVADYRLIYGNVENYLCLPLFSPNTKLKSDITDSPDILRFQNMAAEHTSWLWKYNIKEIKEITSYE